LLAGSLAAFGAVVKEPTLSAQSGSPTVTGVSGTLNHGSVVTVAGAGFGAKPNAAPLKFDDFQGVAVGSLVSTSTVPGPAWKNANSNAFHPTVSNQRLRPGTPFTRNMRSRWRQPQDGGNASSSIYLDNQTFVKFYFDAWLYFDRSLEISRPQNIKPIRLHNVNAGNPSANPAWLPVGAVACQRDGVTRNETDWYSGIDQTTMENRWVHIQWMIDAGAGNNSSTGACISYIDGVLRYDHRNSPTTGPNHYSWPEIYIGNYIRTGDWSGEISAYWDSMYVDSSWARVEIGNNPVYAACTQREIQAPSAWSAGSITVRLNRGSFPSLSGLYLFVVDANGNASPGYRLSGGGGASGPAPAAPTNLRISS
jgi:hypothetical protein